jgi:hypothetical protein
MTLYFFQGFSYSTFADHSLGDAEKIDILESLHFVYTDLDIFVCCFLSLSYLFEEDIIEYKFV